MNDKNLKGVYPATKKDGTVYFRSSITHKNKHISLGSFSNEQEAHQAYWEGALLLTSKSLSLKDYASTSTLAYKKWVILINFRDNDIYLNAPIYLYTNYFEYHLSPTFILKFSIDDLFYYSNKQIMKRGRHFFVADYGMQVNIQNRYGIRSYAVEGRDYIFINNDNMDFRYENIKIINLYNGVTKNGNKYEAKIHINGNYIIGRYDTENEAAIAYNKAIDILKNKGVKKNFTPNYIQDLPASKYADIYSDIKISKKIEEYTPK